MLELALEAFKEGEGVRGCTRESDEHLVVEDTADFLGARFHYKLADGHLSVGAHCNLTVPTDGQDRGASNVQVRAHCAKASGALPLSTASKLYRTCSDD